MQPSELQAVLEENTIKLPKVGTLPSPWPPYKLDLQQILTSSASESDSRRDSGRSRSRSRGRSRSFGGDKTSSDAEDGAVTPDTDEDTASKRGDVEGNRRGDKGTRRNRTSDVARDDIHMTTTEPEIFVDNSDDDAKHNSDSDDEITVNLVHLIEGIWPQSEADLNGDDVFSQDEVVELTHCVSELTSYFLSSHNSNRVVIRMTPRKCCKSASKSTNVDRHVCLVARMNTRFRQISRSSQLLDLLNILRLTYVFVASFERDQERLAIGNGTQANPKNVSWSLYYTAKSYHFQNNRLSFMEVSSKLARRIGSAVKCPGFTILRVDTMTALNIGRQLNGILVLPEETASEIKHIRAGKCNKEN